MERSHSGSFWMEFLSKASRCNTRLGGLCFDWQWDSICWVGLWGWDALPAGLMHDSSQRDSHLLNPSPLNYRYNSSSETFSLLSRTYLTNISVWAVLCAHIGKKNVVFMNVQLEPCKISLCMHAFFCMSIGRTMKHKKRNCCFVGWFVSLGSIVWTTRCNLPKTIIQFLVFPSVFLS